MPKLGIYKCCNLIVVLILSLACQSVSGQYELRVTRMDSMNALELPPLSLQTNFKSRFTCEQYVNSLTGLLQAKGYTTASIDSVQYDTTFAIVHLFIGPQYKLAFLNTSGIEKKLLEQAGWEDSRWIERPLKVEQLDAFQKRMLDYLENNGYPFAKIKLDSILFKDDGFYANLKLDKGPLYKIDSIRILGNFKISKNFIQRYLDISNGSIYKKEKLQNISKKIRELPYVEEQQNWNLTMLGTGSILNLYLKPKKSSQVNVLVGFLPSSQQSTNSNKMLLTGEANINLRNALGNGELISLNWQQIQLKSPRLDLAFQQPYMFGSPFGISTSFNLLKKDSSYVNLNLVAGLQYSIASNKTGRVFIQNLKTNVLSIDSNYIKTFKRLPDVIDVSSVNLGVDYEINTTNFRFSPKSGSELEFTIAAGTRKIKKNNFIVKLSDPNFSYGSLYDTIKQNTYQFRTKIHAAHYLPVGRQSTIKFAANAGWFQSPSIFRNEVFQIGGYKLLRGFDEESIYASRYGVGTVEYRYFLGLNSYMFTFIDAGWAANSSKNMHSNNRFLGGGGGLAFETKAGIFNISLAVGKRDDVKFNLRQSKIHLGYVNFF